MVAGRTTDNDTEHGPDNDGRRSMKSVKKNAKLIAILAIATVGVGGAAWLSAQPAVGEGLTIHVMRAPT